MKSGSAVRDDGGRAEAARGGSAARAVLAAVTVMLSLVALAACSGSGSASPTTSRPTTSASSSSAAASGHCVVNDKGVPSCGALWGVATKPPTAAGVAAVEQAAGRSFDFVYRYHDLGDTIPDAAERALVAQGQLLHIAIAARDFQDSGKQITWAQVAAGEFDASLRTQALGIASLKVPTFVTFQQEANQQRKVGTLGTTADFIAAWRHVHDLYAAAGVHNAVWVWVMTGKSTNLANAAKMWPGNAYVDWISWNVYNQSGCMSDHTTTSQYVSFEDAMKTFYDFVHERGPSIGMDVNKPMMISEAGSAHYPGDMGRTAQWYAQIPQVLREYPSIKAIGLWNSVDGTCDFRFDQDATLSAAVKQAGLDPWVNAHPTVEAVPAP